MKILIHGPVTQADLDNADLLMGWTPTILITDDQTVYPWWTGPVEMHSVNTLIHEEIQESNLALRLAIYADAAIVAGDAPLILKACKSLDVEVYRTNA